MVNKPCIFHWKFQPEFCENNECQRMFEGSVWPIGEWTCNNLIRELLCLSFLSSSHLLSSPATCYLQIRTRWVSQFGSPLKRVMGAVLDKNRADFFCSIYKHKIKYLCRTNNGKNTEEMAHQIVSPKKTSKCYISILPQKKFLRAISFPRMTWKALFFLLCSLARLIASGV